MQSVPAGQWLRRDRVVQASIWLGRSPSHDGEVEPGGTGSFGQFPVPASVTGGGRWPSTASAAPDKAPARGSRSVHGRGYDPAAGGSPDVAPGQSEVLRCQARWG